MRQLVYTMLITNNHPSFYLWWKKYLLKDQKVSKYYYHHCSYWINSGTCKFCISSKISGLNFCLYYMSILQNSAFKDWWWMGLVFLSISFGTGNVQPKDCGCGFKSSCSHLNSRFRACFEQGVPHTETHTWNDENIQSDALKSIKQ